MDAPTLAPVNESKKKRKRNNKDGQSTTSSDVKTITNGHPEPESKKQKKKKKKQQQKSNSTNGDATNKKKKEKKKKKKKQTEEVAAAVNSGETKKRKSPEKASNGNADSSPKLKKRKKDQSETNGHSNGHQNGHSSNGHSSNGHTEVPTGSAMERMAAWHESQTISLLDADNTEFDTAFFPFYNFADAEKTFPSHILTQVSGRFQKPTPIQAQCWPILMARRDIVGIAETGSGKTLAFLLPALVHIEAIKRQDSRIKGPIVLILSPTRELAMQTADVCHEVKLEGTKALCVYGGVDKGPQRTALRQGVEIVVATPGRLLDLMQEGSVSLQNVSYLILDEADRMLDLGFEPDIRKIVASITKPRQTLMFSATWPTAIQQLASEFLQRPVRVSIGSEDLVASHSVTQFVEVVDDRQKDARLLELLKQYHSSRKNRVLVFVLYKKEAVRVEQMLYSRGWKAVAIHGDKDQANRSKAIENFKSGQIPLLIATDVAARGLDIPGVEYVINYSFPLTVEDYVHRIGRTGRGGSKGVSHTLFTQFDKGKAGELVNVLREAKQEIPEALLKFGTHVKKKEHALYGAHFKADSNGGGPMRTAAHVKFD